ncbi:MAG TPA: ankyrin repeat domain-containing protein [Opitutaceae bacterium]|jgi:ankyrin repeat protein|nr:ankyrin repeat domain-containing protein [Opitutaceae bacterium]
MNPSRPSDLWRGTVALVAVLIGGGCFLFPAARSTYRSIHEYAIAGDAAGVADDLNRTPSDLNLPDDAGQTPLHLATVHCRIDVVKLLIAKGADLNRKAKGGATPLHLAAQEGCADAVTALLAAGAEVNPRDDQGRTPLGRAKEWNKPAVVPLLQAHGGTD